MSKYDYLVVGSGLFGSVFAYKARQAGKRILVIEKRHHIGGNVYCENIEGIQVHKYGPHIFHTDKKEIWDFVNSFVTFRQYTHSPMACYKGKFYNMPFNMNTFYSIWGITKPDNAKRMIQQQIEKAGITDPKNLEEQAISLVGKDIYEILIKGYTEKQWGRKCTDLPPSIINRLAVRHTFDNNYFDDQYQGIPEGGYNILIDGLLSGIEIRTNIDFFDNKSYWESLANNIVYTGRIDTFYNFCFGNLEYRTIRFEDETLDCDNFQGCAVLNFTEAKIEYTRIIEHKHFENKKQSKTVISREFSDECDQDSEPFYPINDAKNMNTYEKYNEMACREERVIFGGRLSEYEYLNMDQVIDNALNSFDKHMEK